jgi:hypothetical protein
MLDLVERISPLFCSSLLSHSAWLRWQAAARFLDFVVSSHDLDLQAIHQKLPGSAITFYSNANQLEDAWCLTVVL